ncbi:hypothetical protein F4809DRAFT_641363 [Biscogniauxia mediterranea]|nr:hypothetical protein F4809DRAFT_641363 [Biscogniauxia mediterranea]
MSRIRLPLRKRQRQWHPTKVDPTDIVYPMYMEDSPTFALNMIVNWSFLFNDVLDADRLRVSLTELLSSGDWKKLGGRIHKKINFEKKRLKRPKKSEWEIHVPREFTAERPAFQYFHDKSHRGMPIRKSSTELSSSETLMLDWQNAPTPLAIHITAFADATIVGISFPNSMMDAGGLATLLATWPMVVNGCPDKIRPLAGARKDVIRETIKKPRKEYTSQDSSLGKYNQSLLLRNVSIAIFMLLPASLLGVFVSSALCQPCLKRWSGRGPRTLDEHDVVDEHAQEERFYTDEG